VGLLIRRLRRLELRTHRDASANPLSGPALQQAQATLAAKYGLTLAEVMAQHGDWPAFCYWVIMHRPESNIPDTDEGSAQHGYMAMLDRT